MKNISFLFEYFQILEVKFSVYLNRRVFVMRGPWCVMRSSAPSDSMFLVFVILLKFNSDLFEITLTFCHSLKVCM